MTRWSVRAFTSTFRGSNPLGGSPPPWSSLRPPLLDCVATHDRARMAPGWRASSIGTGTIDEGYVANVPPHTERACIAAPTETPV